VEGFLFMREIFTGEKIEQVEAWRLLEADLTPQDVAISQRLLIPKPLLFGTQTPEHYEGSTKRWMREVQMSPEGMIELLRNPAIVVGIHEGSSHLLYISDGHNRVRYGVRAVVPALVFSEDHALAIINRGNKKPLTSEAYRDFMHARATDALHAFSKSLPSEKYPKRIAGMESLRDLCKIPGVRPY